MDARPETKKTQKECFAEHDWYLKLIESTPRTKRYYGYEKVIDQSYNDCMGFTTDEERHKALGYKVDRYMKNEYERKPWKAPKEYTQWPFWWRDHPFEETDPDKWPKPWGDPSKDWSREAE